MATLCCWVCMESCADAGYSARAPSGGACAPATLHTALLAARGVTGVAAAVEACWAALVLAANSRHGGLHVLDPALRTLWTLLLAMALLTVAVSLALFIVTAWPERRPGGECRLPGARGRARRCRPMVADLAWDVALSAWWWTALVLSVLGMLPGHGAAGIALALLLAVCCVTSGGLTAGLRSHYELEPAPGSRQNGEAPGGAAADSGLTGAAPVVQVLAHKT